MPVIENYLSFKEAFDAVVVDPLGDSPSFAAV